MYTSCPGIVPVLDLCWYHQGLATCNVPGFFPFKPKTAGAKYVVIHLLIEIGVLCVLLYYIRIKICYVVFWSTDLLRGKNDILWMSDSWGNGPDYTGILTVIRKHSVNVKTFTVHLQKVGVQISQAQSITFFLTHHHISALLWSSGSSVCVCARAWWWGTGHSLPAHLPLFSPFRSSISSNGRATAHDGKGQAASPSPPVSPPLLRVDFQNSRGGCSWNITPCEFQLMENIINNPKMLEHYSHLLLHAVNIKSFLFVVYWGLISSTIGPK